MADGAWSVGCRSDVEWYGYPGWGAYYRSRFGTYGVSGGVYQKFASMGYECGALGPPVKAYGWIQEMNYGRGCYGQWFLGGAVGYHDGAWRVMLGNYGQTGGTRFAALRHKLRSIKHSRVDAEIPLDAPGPPPGDGHRQG